jgi:hypothetical protein
MNATLTPSLHTCKALKDAGFPQDTVLTWITPTGRAQKPSVSPRGVADRTEEESAAPTLTELLAHLPAELALAVPHPIYGSLERVHTLELSLGHRATIGYHLVGSHDVQHRVERDSAVEAAAHLFLALHTDGRLDVPVAHGSVHGVLPAEAVESLARAA